MPTPEEMMMNEAMPTARGPGAAAAFIPHDEKMTADQARVKLQREGMNLNSEQKDELMRIASGMDAPKPTFSQAISPFGTNPGPAVLSGEDIADGEPLILCQFTRTLRITDRPGRVVEFHAGLDQVPLRYLKPVMHTYMRLNGVIQKGELPPDAPAPDKTKADDSKTKKVELAAQV